MCGKDTAAAGAQSERHRGASMARRTVARPTGVWSEGLLAVVHRTWHRIAAAWRRCHRNGSALKRLAIGGLLASGLLASAPALAQDRTLSLYNTHTHERLTVTYKRNGRFVQNGLDQLNRFLRDWRRDEVTRIDPALFDIVWTVYRDVRASQPIHVVSAYRSPATNNMLRRRSSGVANNSQHTRGRAMDFFIPGVSAAELRAAGLRLQRGGVGYYPTSNTPFVHLDTGSVRMWPRMTRDQLSRVFPDGRTIHIPADGRPMPGYDQALRDLQRGGSATTTAIASAATSVSAARDEGDGDIVLPSEGDGNFFAALFGGNRNRDAAPAAASAPASQPAPVATQPAPAAVEVAAVEPESGPRSPYAAPSPVLPPNAATVPGLAPSTIAGLAVPAPVPAPTLDELQIAALSASPAIPDIAQIPQPAAVAAAFATAEAAPQPESPPLPPITRAGQIAQTVPASGQIAAIIEARFAEQRAQEAALQTMVAQSLANRETPAAASIDAPVELAAAGPRFVPPAPTPVQLARPSDVPLPLASANAPAPSAPTALANAFTANSPATSPGQSAIDSVAGIRSTVVAPVLPPAPLASASGIITGSTRTASSAALHPISGDLAASLAKQSIRGEAHAQFVAPTATVDLSPVVASDTRFVPNRPFSPRSDGFAVRGLTSTFSGQ